MELVRRSILQQYHLIGLETHGQYELLLIWLLVLPQRFVHAFFEHLFDFINHVINPWELVIFQTISNYDIDINELAYFKMLTPNYTIVSVY